MGVATILIVEDHAESLDYLTTLLGYRAYRVLRARNAGEGLAAARAEIPNLIITDVLMPDCDGYEFTRQLRADHATAKIPIIFWTASYGRRGNAIALAENFGVECVLAKPTDPQELLGAVERVLNRPAVSHKQIDQDLVDEHTRLLTNEVLDQAGEIRDLERIHDLRAKWADDLTRLRTNLEWCASHLAPDGAGSAQAGAKLSACLEIVDGLRANLQMLPLSALSRKKASQSRAQARD